MDGAPKRNDTVLRFFVVAGVCLTLGYTTGRLHAAFNNRSTPATRARDVLSKRASTTDATDTDALAYGSSKVEIFDVESKLHRDYKTAPETPVVYGKLRNSGDRTLGHVRLIAYFMDEAGKDIFEMEYSPVRTGSSLGTAPLRPNYINEWGFKCADCPGAWAPGKVRVAVKKVEFE